MTQKLLTTIAALLACATLHAQQAPASIDSGMTRAQVIARLGPPLSIRSTADHTYLFYRNGCEKTCGINDLVVLDSGKVVDAVFRSPLRKYSGRSSSPAMIPAADARKGNGAPLKTDTVSTAEQRPAPPKPAAKPITKKPPPNLSLGIPSEGAQRRSEECSP